MDGPAAVALTNAEQTLRRLLLDVVDFIHQNPVPKNKNLIPAPTDLSKERLVLRFTGGWVRDKLLKTESNDIDIGINVMTGFEFGLRMKEYLDAPGIATQYQYEGPDKKARTVTRIAKVEANPDKSKHLETATTTVLGFDIDLVNLRKETYAGDSRNPQVEFGTPEEDAMRRDATINAMFYNIHTSSVEDFTGKGLQDLKDGIIRTPLEPYQTFIDDPLRVLRLIRFASRFGYSIDHEALQMMKNKEIRQALMIKISRERVLIEVEKMLKGRDPRGSVELIESTSLYQCIFGEPEQPDFYKADLTNWSATYHALADILNANDLASGSKLRSLLVRDKDDKYVAWIIGCMVPLAEAPKIKTKNGKKMEDFITRVAHEGLKLPNRVSNILTASKDNLDDIKDIVQSKQVARDTIGMALRRWGSTWRLQLLFSALHDIFLEPSAKQAVIDRYQKLLAHCEDLDVLSVYDLKPLLDGTTLAKSLDTRPGPWMKDALDVVVAWQLRNPESRDPDAVVAEIRSWKQKYDETHGANNTGGQKKHPTKSSTNIISPKKQKQGELNSALIYHFLHLTIRPIFSQAQHPDLTSTGRRNINANITRKNQSMDISPDLPAWMVKESWSLDLLTWVSRTIDSNLIEQNWGALIPPVLTILDSSDIKMKARGCTLLSNILTNTSPVLLKRTGLIPVFEASLYICVTYLPSFTSPEESAFLLNVAIPATLSLANASHPEPSKERTTALLNILRKALLAPYAHASEHLVIAETLFDRLPSAVEALGIDCVVHLKDLVPMVSNTLDEPLGLSYPPLLISCLKSLLVLLQEAKPRAWFWRGDILRGVCGLWLRLHPLDSQVSDTNKDTEELKRLSVNAVDMLDDAITDEEWTDEETRDIWPNEVQILIEADTRLKPLFVNIHKGD